MMHSMSDGFDVRYCCRTRAWILATSCGDDPRCGAGPARGRVLRHRVARPAVAGHSAFMVGWPQAAASCPGRQPRIAEVAAPVCSAGSTPEAAKAGEPSAVGPEPV